MPMKKYFSASLIATTVIISMSGYFAWARWLDVPEPPPACVALLVPDALPGDSPFINMWRDSAQEEGVCLRAVRIGEWRRVASRGGLQWEGAILPDTFHREVSDTMVASLHTYVEAGGRLMLIYDGGLLDGGGFYSAGKSRLSDLAGVDYGMYEELGQGLAARSRFGLGQASDMARLHIPPGRFASPTLTFPSSTLPLDIARKDYQAIIFDYNKLPQSFATLVTRGTPSKTLMTNEDGGTLAGRQRFGKGETLFVNFPLTYLKQRTDGIFLHSFLTYFASDMLGQPRMANTPDGKGGIVLNWHVDAKPALAPLKKLRDVGIFDEGPFSFHFTAGPDVNVAGDGGGLNVPVDPEVRGLIKGLLAQGHAVGDHGGWIHNYFGNGVNADNQALFEPFLTLNQTAMTEITGSPPREYSAPVGNQPAWVTRWLEAQGFAGYYLTGNVGMGPTHAWLDSKRMSSMWAFPVLTMGPVATAEDAFFQQVPAESYENWLVEVAKFVEREQVLRLVYFHPPGAILYLPAVTRFVNTIKACRAAGHCRWVTMTQAADFLTRREKVRWYVEAQPSGMSLVAEDAQDLAHMAWWVPQGRFKKPVLVEGKATIDQHGANWRITDTGGSRLRVDLPLK